MKEGGAGESVIELVEGGQIITTEKTSHEYIKALLKADRVDDAIRAAKRVPLPASPSSSSISSSISSSSPLLQFGSNAVKSNRFNSSSNNSSNGHSNKYGLFSSLQQQQQEAGVFGSVGNPIYVQTLEGTFKSQGWRTLRFLVSASLGMHLSLSLSPPLPLTPSFDCVHVSVC